MSDLEVSPSIQLNTRGLRCPEPVMMLHQAIRKSKSGDVVEVFATGQFNFMGYSEILYASWA